MPGASYLAVTSGARPGRILRAAPQVMSLRRVHDSNCDSIVSHPNDLAQRPGPLPGQYTRKRRDAAPVRCSGWFGRVLLVDHQTPGINRLVVAMYASYSLPNSSSIMHSSGPMRKATRKATATPPDGPTNQLGSTRA